MPDIPIYDGTLGVVSGSTPFGYYDTDPIFQIDAIKFSKWSATRLGWPIVNVELQSGSFYSAFEEAITVYGNEIYQYKLRENYLTMEGNLVPTASDFSFNNSVVTPNLGRMISIAKSYGTEAGTGGNVKWYTGSLTLTAGIQDYDLNKWADDNLDLVDGDSIEIKKVFFQQAPAIVRYFDPYAGTGTGLTNLMEAFGFGGMSPGINFMLMPIYFDLEKIQSIELNDQIRRSAYSFDLVGNQLRLFPIPPVDGAALFFHYIKVSERNASITNQLSGGGISGSITTTRTITNIGNVPYNNPVYHEINAIGKQWIMQYGLAVAKETLGFIRTKYQSIPIPGSEITLNGSALIDSAVKMKDDLLAQLRATLEETSRKTQLTNQSQEAELLKNTLNNVPNAIYIM